MKIFLTGGSGFVGSNLKEFYVQHEIFEYKRATKLSDAEVGFYFTHALRNFKPDLIINCAAEIYDAPSMFLANVEMTKWCLDYVKANRNVKMVQIGSSAEYGPVDRASSEQDRINPVDMYQATKGAATLLCQGFARQFQLDVTIARPYSVYGKYERPHRLFPRLWRAFYKNEPMTLFDGYHDFIYIDDFVRGINILVKSDTRKNLGDIVNFGSGIQYSNKQIYDLFKDISGKEAPVTFSNKLSKQFESSVWVCNTAYAKQNYGFVTEYDIKAGIRKFISTSTY